MKKRLKKIKSDKDAERLLRGDLSKYLSKKSFSKVSFEFSPKDTSISLRLSSDLLRAVKLASKKRGVSYQKYIREALEQSLIDNLS